MPPRTERLAAAFFEKQNDATEAIAALRQAGLAQIGVASHDDNQERKLADKTATQPGVAVSPNAGSRLQRTDQDADYASLADIHGTLMAAGLTEHQASYYRERLEHNGILVTTAAPAGEWHTAQRTLEEYGGDAAAEMPGGAASVSPTPEPPAAAPTVMEPVEAVEQTRLEIPVVQAESTPARPTPPSPAVVHPEPGTPQSDFEPTTGMAPIELRGTLREVHRERHPENEHREDGRKDDGRKAA